MHSLARQITFYLSLSVHFLFFFPIIYLIGTCCYTASAQAPPPAPKGLKIVTNPQNTGEVISSPPQSPISRKTGPFYELHITLSQIELSHSPIIRYCGKNKRVRIEKIGNNLFSADFYVNANPAGTPYLFQRHWLGSHRWCGGAKLSERYCSTGVVVDGGSQISFDYEVYLIDTDTGSVLFPDGVSFYPKMKNVGGRHCEEPKIWFSPDESVVMIIAGNNSGWRSGAKNSQAHFIDLSSGHTIRKVLFNWPEKTSSTFPYHAEMKIHNGKMRIIFTLENKIFAVIAVP